MGFGAGAGALGGGLDVQQIVQQLIFVEAEPIRRLERAGTQVQQKVDAFRDFKNKLTELAGQLAALNSPEKFAARSVKSSNDDVLTATASSTAVPGTYNIVVNRLALVDNFASDATFATSGETLGTGSFDLQVGTETTTITIDASNNNLEGLKNAINNSGAKVRANIVNDGTGFRLTVTSEESGSANAISVQNNTLTLADGSTPFGLTRTHPGITAGNENLLDAELTVNGLLITSSDNNVTDVIEGVSIDLTGISASTVSLTISNDTEQVKEALQGFVDSYNDAVNFINGQFTFVATTGRAGTLSGDGILRRVQGDLAAIVRSAVPGLSGNLTSLRSIGVELQSDGTLEINSEKLDDALDDNFDDFQKLFVAFGETTGSNIIFRTSGQDSVAGTYEVQITQAAESAVVSSTNAIGATLGVNETLTFTLGTGQSVVNLTSGQDLASVLQTLNAQFNADGLGLTATADASNRLVFTSTAKGSTVDLTVVSDVDGAGTGIGTAGLSDQGLDVAGNFVDTATGTVLAATGSGSLLTGTEGGANDLVVEILGTTTGSLGNVTFTLGYAERLENLLNGVTDEIDGPIKSALDRLEGQIKGLEDEIANFEERLELRRVVLIEEFTRADQALRQLAALQTTLGGIR